MKKMNILTLTLLFFVTSCGLQRNTSSQAEDFKKEKSSTTRVILTKDYLSKTFKNPDGGYNLDKLKGVEFYTAGSSININYAGTEVTSGDVIIYKDEIQIGEIATFTGLRGDDALFKVREYTIIANFGPDGVMRGKNILEVQGDASGVIFEFDQIEKQKPSGTPTQDGGFGSN